jgi:hypothetical protein
MDWPTDRRRNIRIRLKDSSVGREPPFIEDLNTEKEE